MPSLLWKLVGDGMNDEHRREVVERDDDGDRGNGVGNIVFFIIFSL